MSSTVGLRRSVLGGKRSRNRGSGWGGGWQDRLDIPKAEPTPIVVTRGAYAMKGKDKEECATEDDPDPLAHYHTCSSHGVKLKPSGPGSYYSARCNRDAGDEDCLLCWAAESERDRRVGTKNLYSFGILHLAIHQRVQKRDGHGKVIYSERDTNNYKRGEAILEWKEITKPRDLDDILEDLDELLELGKELEEDGVCMLRKKYVEVGSSHRDQLVEIEAKAAQLCLCGGDITAFAFSCEKCEEEVMDIKKDNFSAKEVAVFAGERQRCPYCSHAGFPIPIPTCDDCAEPRPLTFCDVVAFVRKKGENTNSRIEVEKVIRLDLFNLPDGSSLLEWEEDGDDEFPVEDDDGNWVFTEDHGVQKLATNMWNFEKVHKPRDHGYHAGRIGKEVPRNFVPSKAASANQGNPNADKYRKYGSNRVDSKKDDTEEEEETSQKGRRGRRRGRREEPEQGPPRRRRRSSH